MRPGKHGTIQSSTPPILVKLGLRETHWKSDVLGIESRYWRAIGSAQALIDNAAAIGQCWLKGIGSARDVLRSAS